ncbi:Uncharacterised protein [Vibrio cholerae]|nr:Uncharacterised protein [Vibrio cholerae]CSB80229.1 Uncharacterised protein [Vibrio cholerae]CSC66332.1 Uncharacterised protein [Vibrio cholerae]CSD75968.1 Uncharacterised protein [Vibrio cholerae]
MSIIDSQTVIGRLNFSQDVALLNASALFDMELTDFTCHSKTQMRTFSRIGHRRKKELITDFFTCLRHLYSR